MGTAGDQIGGSGASPRSWPARIAWWRYSAAASCCARPTWTGAGAFTVGPGGLPRVRACRRSRRGVLPRPGTAGGIRARARPARGLGDDLAAGPGCPRRARPPGRGRGQCLARASAGAVGPGRNVDRGSRWRPDRAGRGALRSPAAPRPAMTLKVTALARTLQCPRRLRRRRHEDRDEARPHLLQERQPDRRLFASMRIHGAAARKVQIGRFCACGTALLEFPSARDLVGRGGRQARRSELYLQAARMASLTWH